MKQTKEKEWDEVKYQAKLEKAKVCSICYCQYAGFGNNAQPVNIGRCCDDCNGIVVGARINLMSTRSLIA